MAPVMLEELKDIYLVDESKLLDSLRELQADGMIDLFPWDKSYRISISGLGLQRLDLIEQLKSRSYLKMLENLLEAKLLPADPKDRIKWKKRIADVAQTLVTKTSEVLISSAINNTLTK